MSLIANSKSYAEHTVMCSHASVVVEWLLECSNIVREAEMRDVAVQGRGSHIFVLFVVFWLCYITMETEHRSAGSETLINDFTTCVHACMFCG